VKKAAKLDARDLLDICAMRGVQATSAAASSGDRVAAAAGALETVPRVEVASVVAVAAPVATEEVPDEGHPSADEALPSDDLDDAVVED